MVPREIMVGLEVRKGMLMMGTVAGHRLGWSRQHRDAFYRGHCSVCVGGEGGGGDNVDEDYEGLVGGMEDGGKGDDATLASHIKSV